MAVRQAFSFRRGRASAFCWATVSAMRARRSAASSKPSVSLAHSSVTSGRTFFLTTLTSTSKLILSVLPESADSMMGGSAGMSSVNEALWPFFRPTSCSSNSAGNRPAPKP